ncbi:hypothetical protein [Tardiphaga sp. P9-11]|jgi:hypothetical protein|nr:hypothetical protein [Tardiphaga sp. P9-11]
MSRWRAAAGAPNIQHTIQHDDDVGYYGGWTISGLAVLATIGVVWVLGI